MKKKLNGLFCRLCSTVGTGLSQYRWLSWSRAPGGRPGLTEGGPAAAAEEGPTNIIIFEGTGSQDQN